MDIKILSPNEAAGYNDGSGDSHPRVEMPSVDSGTPEGDAPQTYNVDTRRLGRFEVIGTIGRGGMGEVLRGRNPDTGEEIALKVLDEAALQDRETLMRFEREANAAQELDHPNIAKMYGLHYDQEGRPFIVMEFVSGVSLDHVVRDRLDVLFSTMLDWTIQTSKGLEFARRRGIIHRDIKPANLILTPDGVVKVIDFGLAKSLWDQNSLTATGMVVGTPRYMSPEQGMGRNVDHRSDIYSLGCTLYEFITRQTPFDGDTPMAIMMKHINTPVTAPYNLHPKCPMDVNDIVLRMMSKDPNERYQDYEELIHDLESARIHRLAKEKAIDAKPHELDMHGSPTLVDLDPIDPRAASGTQNNVGRPSAYLKEGLVSLDLSDVPDPDDSPRSPFMWATIVLVILGIVGFIWWQQSHTVDGEKKPSWVSKLLVRFLGNNTSESKELEELAKKDADNIASTRSRMEALIYKVNEYRRSHSGNFPSVRDLKKEGATDNEVSDAWGNLFTIRRAGSDLVIISGGRDATPGNDDDLRFSVDGTDRQVPPALKPEDLATNQEKANGAASSK